MALKPFPTQITLTADADLAAKLRRKLEEYERRLAFQAPEVDPHATYKYRALDKLLRHGSLDVAELRADCETLSWFSRAAFEDAIRVIDAYSANDLTSVSGGTGLR